MSKRKKTALDGAGTYDGETLEKAAVTIRGLIGYHKRMTMNECTACVECKAHDALAACPNRMFEDVYLQSLEVALALIEKARSASV